MELSSIPVSLESRYCVLLGGDREALPASLISQIGYRCHPALYTEGDPGERLELIAGEWKPQTTHTLPTQISILHTGTSRALGLRSGDSG